MSSQRLITVLRSLAIMVMLAGIGWLFPSAANAECGREYVVIVENKNNPEHRPVAANHQQNPPTRHHNEPCRGPNCSQKPAPAPLAPAPAPVNVFPDAKAYLTEYLPSVSPTTNQPVPASSTDRAISQPSAIFHPPRFTA